MQKVISLQESLIGLGLYDRYYKMYYDVNAGNFGWKLGEEIERFSKLKEALSAFGKLDSVIIIDKSLLGKTNNYSLKESFKAINIYDELMEEYLVSQFFINRGNSESSYKLQFDINDETRKYKHLYSTMNEFLGYNHNITLRDIENYKELKDITTIELLKSRNSYFDKSVIESFKDVQKGAFQPIINYSDKIDALRWAYGYIKPPKKNFRVFQESPFCNFTELWNDTFSTSLEAKRKIVSLKDKFKEGTKLRIFEVKEEYTIETEATSFNKLKRI